MNSLIEQSNHLVSNTPLNFKRYLYSRIRWNNRLIGIKGARGTGKSTLLLQWLRDQNLPARKAAYFSLDDLYFTNHSLKETALDFHKQGGEILVLDEVHKYKTWSTEIKNLYDFYKDLKIIFTGSSIIDISRQEGDLSRRALMYELHGLSFREFVLMKENIELPRFELEDLFRNPDSIVQLIPKGFRPFEYFSEYLDRGYYPFVLEDPDSVHQRLNQLVRTIVEYDMAELKDFDIRNAKKLLQLVYIIAQQVPFKPNLSALAQKSNIHRNSLTSYLHYLEKAKIITLLYPKGRSVAILQKPEKIYLNNTNLQITLAENIAEIGSVRETFVLSQLHPEHKVNMPPIGDFIIDDTYTIEIGGKGKSRTQIKGVKDAWVVKDNIEIPAPGVLPIWMFGLLY